jgi:GNAT superfamily N-acetyltransferase
VRAAGRKQTQRGHQERDHSSGGQLRRLVTLAELETRSSWGAYAYSSTLADWQGERDTEKRWRNRLSVAAVNIVADLNGTTAGMVSGTTPNQDEQWSSSQCGWRHSRGHGVGDALVTAVVEWARKQGAARIALAVFESNDHAVTLYRRHRFVDAGATDSTDVRQTMVLALDTPTLTESAKPEV